MRDSGIRIEPKTLLELSRLLTGVNQSVDCTFNKSMPSSDVIFKLLENLFLPLLPGELIGTDFELIHEKWIRPEA